MNVSMWLAAVALVCIVVLLVMVATPSFVGKWPLVGIAVYVGAWVCLAIAAAIEGALNTAILLGLMAVIPVLAVLWLGRDCE